MNYQVLREISLLPSTSTGRTKHFAGSRELPTPAKLQIAQYVNGSGFYLFYLDDHGSIMTDTFHDSMEGAMDQAQWEFDIEMKDWKIINSGG